jgi:hypothetical protein
MATCNRCTRGLHDCEASYCRCAVCPGGEKSREERELPADLPLVDLSTPAWHGLAACASPTVPQEIFFAEVGGHRGEESADLSSYGRAQRICSRCPGSVRRQCLADAITTEGTGLAFGVWGGVPPERRREARKDGRGPDETLDVLEEWFRSEAPRWLTDDEEVLT